MKVRYLEVVIQGCMERSFAKEELMKGWREGLLLGGNDTGLDRMFATWRK